jgi:hypothetical protein
LNLTSDAWRDAMQVAACSRAFQQIIGQMLRERIPALAQHSIDDEESCGGVPWSTLLARLLSGGAGKWLKLNTVRAVRPMQNEMAPLQSAPRLSGASLCAIAPGKLCVFGGRSASNGETHDATILATVTWRAPAAASADRASPRGLVVWDKLRCEMSPPARCYHSATMMGESMVVVGGAATDGDVLLDDVWSLCSSLLRWQPVDCVGHSRPSARSSHICCAWHSEEHGPVLVLHGGLGAKGVTGDVWLLRRQSSSAASRGARAERALMAAQWQMLETSGDAVKRAHHSGGVVGTGDAASLLVFSGQDEHLLTVGVLASLSLATATWHSLVLPTDGPAGGISPRIDGAAANVEGVGLVVFGGVGDTFGFVEASDAWLLRRAADAVRPPPRRLCDTMMARRANPSPASNVATTAPVPAARACQGLCADGLRVYLFGGFDGERDLDDLWCLSLLPAAFHEPVHAQIKTHDELVSAEFKARRARQATVLHATPGAAGHNFNPLSLHRRVYEAGLTPAAAEGEPAGTGRTLPDNVVEREPAMKIT